MSNDKTKEPLLSEYDTQNLWDDVVRPVVRAMEKSMGHCSNAYAAGEMARVIVPIYEASRKQDKDRIDELTGLVQELVDALEGACSYARTFDECPYLDGENALSKAKQSGFTPNS